MFSIFKKKFNAERSLFDLLNEMEKNLENFYVMDQRQFITQGYLTDAWDKVKDLGLIKRHETIVKYAAVMEDFNNSLKAYKEFETWYTQDINRKTPETARKLHDMKNALDAKLKGMEALIIYAGQDLEREMLQLGLLKS